MQIRVAHANNSSIVHLEGDMLGEMDRSALNDRIREIVASGCNHIIIDLGGVKHLNSCGLGSLVCALTTVRRAGGELHLARVGPMVLGVLTMTKLNEILLIDTTVEEAKSEMKKKGK